MAIARKKIYVLVMFIGFIFLLNNHVFAVENLDLNKKVVSLVFDDSGSMVGEKEENANYALQALISMLGVNDELNIVKMSAPYEENLFDISQSSKKQISIESVRNWISDGGTPFDAVDTARDWLYQRKEVLCDNAEYWLIIITDGQFNYYYNGNHEIDIYDYMGNINDKFIGLKFDSILLSIGNELDDYYLDAFKIIPNCSVEEAKKAKDIVPTMFEISSKINSGLNTQEIEQEKLETNKIVLDLNLPIYKMNIFIQKSGLEIVDVTSDNGKEFSLDMYDIKTNKKTAKMNEIYSSKGYLEGGKYTITFNDEVDLDTTQIKIYVQAAVDNVLSLYKRDGDTDILLSDTDFFMLDENEAIIAKSELISLIDGKLIDVDSLNKVNGYYYINDKKSYGKFEDGKLMTEIILDSEKNTIYSLIESEGFVNAKSNVIVIDFTNIEDVLIQYNNSDTYEKNDEILLDEINAGSDIVLNNLPAGIVVEYEKIEYSNGEKILLSDTTKNLIIKANKEYREVAPVIAEIVINDNGDIYKKFLKIRPKTAKYEFIKVNEDQNDINMDNPILKLKIKYEIQNMIKELDVTDIKKIFFEEVSKGYTIKVNLDEESNEIILRIKPNLLSIFSKRQIDFVISANLKDSLGVASSNFEFQIMNYNILKVLLPYIIGLLLVIILCGYLFKNRFAKTAYMVISSEDSPYSLRECRIGMKRYLPFVSDTVKLPNVELKARKAKKIELISAMEEILEVNGDTNIPNKKILSINNGEFILKEGCRNIKYEYVSLTPDEIIEASEEKDNNEVNWF